MKILVISLLRLGDLVMLTPTLAGLRRRHPDAEIHLLTNRENEKIATRVPGVTRIHYFERHLIQTSLGEADRSLFEGHDRLTDLLLRLNEVQYQLVVNLTQTRLSGLIAGQIQAEQTLGLSFHNGAPASFGSPWFRHLNDMAAETASRTFHYSDLFYFASGLEDAPGPYELRGPSAATREKFKNIESGIAFHMWTSDPKKNWDEAHWIEWLTHLHRTRPETPLYVLGAPSDNGRLRAFVRRCEEQGLPIIAFGLDFDDLAAFLPRMRLFVTVDTSVKHVAATTSVKILELALGGSDYRKTGVYKPGSLIVTPKTECYPCPQAAPCTQATHVCAQSVTAQSLALITHAFMESDWKGLHALATECADELRLLRTRHAENGFWLAEELTQDGRKRLFEQAFQLAAWRMTLNRDYLKSVVPAGTEGRRLADALKRIAPESGEVAILRVLFSQLESKWRENEMALDRVVAKYNASLKTSHALDDDVAQELARLEADLGFHGYISQNVEDIKNTGLLSVKRLRESLNELRQQHIAKIKILNAVREHAAGGPGL